ncbi:hypothetical protein [Georgenia yuyongxinii]
MALAVNLPRCRSETSANIRSPTAPSPVSTAAHCPSVNRRASPAAVVEAGPATGPSLPGDIGAHPVQPDQEVLPGQLRRGHPHQQLTARQATSALLDRPDRLIQRLDHTELLDQLTDRRQPRVRRQARIRPPDFHSSPATRPHIDLLATAVPLA